MDHSFQGPCRIEEAAFNPDLWTGVFLWLLLHAGENQADATLYRQSGETKKAIAVRKRQGVEISPPEIEFIPLDNISRGAPAIEFHLDDDLYGIHAAVAGGDAAPLLQKIVEVKEEIAFSIKVNRALLSTKTCFCVTRSVLEPLQDPAFKLTLDGVVTWQNEAAAADAWQPVFSSGAGKPLTLVQTREQAALRSALAEIGSSSDTSARLIPVSIPDKAENAIMALKAVRPSYPYKSRWVELFKPAPRAIAVIRSPDSKPDLSPSLLRQLYGLTAKEANLAIALAQGELLKEYADRTGVSFETARWHSKRVMQKMHCTKQQEVMYTLLYRNALFSILD